MTAAFHSGAGMTWGSWPWQCWALWVYAIVMGALTQASGEPGNVYLAAMCVMAFCHYLRRAPKPRGEHG